MVKHGHKVIVFPPSDISPITSVTSNRNTVTTAATPVNDGGLLVNVLGDIDLVSASPAQNSAKHVTPGADEGFRKFLLKNNGVLFENDILQIGVKSEYKKNLGKILLTMFIAVNLYR